MDPIILTPEQLASLPETPHRVEPTSDHQIVCDRCFSTLEPTQSYFSFDVTDPKPASSSSSSSSSDSPKKTIYICSKCVCELKKTKKPNKANIQPTVQFQPLRRNLTRMRVPQRRPERNNPNNKKV
eukprot:TRINITY_DN1349_c0_g1_i3.p1 TRINITY_DN1349_c0_g1~~TRINITY_DN1349_c0_g1_i3.p1  ORF type:complete len:126 (-),score=30.28 TRINITY_DN1349_c0_g1_i3:54-431(-)